MPEQAAPGARFDFTKSRVLLFDEHDCVLLFLTRAPVSTNPTRWVTPGGHVEAGESHLDAAVRELFEETGLPVSADSLGEPIFSHEFSDEREPGVFKTNYEQWFSVRTVRFPLSEAGWTDDEKVDMVASRWWSLAELESTDELLEPDELITLIRQQLGSPA